MLGKDRLRIEITDIHEFEANVKKSFNWFFNQYKVELKETKDELAHGSGLRRFALIFSTRDLDCEISFYSEAGVSVSLRTAGSNAEKTWYSLANLCEYLEDKELDDFCPPEGVTISSLNYLSNLLKSHHTALFDLLKNESDWLDDYKNFQEKQLQKVYYGD